MNPPSSNSNERAQFTSAFRPLQSPLIGQIDFWLLAGFLVLLNVRRMSSVYIPIHDSMQVFQYFHFFYSSLLFDGQWPEWVSYGVYGMAADFWALFCLTPASLLTAAVGKLLGVTDALLLFKASMALEEFMFLAGLYWLCRLLYEHRLSASFVCLGAVIGLNWYTQLWWNFRIFYMVPAALACILCFFHERRPLHLWLAGLVYITSLLGSLAYFAPLFLALNVPFLAVLTVKDPSIWKTLWSQPRRHLWLLGLLIVFTGCYLAAIRGAMEPLASAAPGREESGQVTLFHFLTYGGRADFFALLKQALLGWPVFGIWNDFFPDQSFYIGLLPWPLVFWAARRVRRAEFYAVAATGLFLVFMIAGGSFAVLCYRLLPGMRYFRHLSELLSLTKILVLLVAGFGFDDFIERACAWHLWLLAGCLILLGDFVGGPDFATSLLSLRKGIAGTASSLFALRIFIYAFMLAGAGIIVMSDGLRRRISLPASAWRIVPRSLIAIVAAAYLVDMLTFRWLSDQAVPPVPSSLVDALASLRASKLDFRKERSDRAPDDRVRQARRLFASINPWCVSSGRLAGWEAPLVFKVQLNHISYALLHEDPCESDYFVPVCSRNVSELLDARDRDLPFARVLGCDAPKLRLVPRAVFVEGVAKAYDVVRTTPAIDEVVVIPRALAAGETVTPSAPAAGGDDIRVLRFTANSLQLEVDWRGSVPAWLVYADAYHPEWHARINDNAVPVEAAYGTFKAVRVPPGKSRVEFHFRGSRPSLPVTVAAFGIVGWLSILGFILSRSPKTQYGASS
jgi:hypothetical protein